MVGLLLLGLALASAAATAATGAMTLRAELTTRRDVLCARYAALSALALARHDPGAASRGPPHSPAIPARAKVEMVLEYDSPAICRLRVRASCGSAGRTMAVSTSEPRLCKG